MSNQSKDKTRRKVCFVTIGATASFNSLIKSALSPAFLTALKQYGYTDLRMQYGAEGAKILENHENHQIADTASQRWPKISGFDFNKEGFDAEMRAAKGGAKSLEGAVISHAGSGSILGALRIAVPLIVVPNPSLLDNHQVELAEELAAQGYVIHGQLDDLPSALHQSESIRKNEMKNSWPPSNKETDPAGRGLVGIMDDELGFVD